MRFLACILLFPFFSLTASAQNPAHLPPVLIKKLDKPNVYTGAKTAYFPCPFAEPQIQDSLILKEIRKGRIIRVELYYTQFRRSEQFDQIGLNAERYRRLNQLLPGLLKDDLILFRNYEQSEAVDLENARRFYHGFVLTYLPESSEETHREEILALRRYLGKEGDKKKNLTQYDKSGLSFYDKGPRFSTEACALESYLNANISYSAEAIHKNIRGLSKVSFVVNRKGEIQDFKVLKALGSGLEDAIKNALEYMPRWEAASNKGVAVNALVDLSVYFGIKAHAVPDGACPPIEIHHKELLKNEWRIHPQQRIISQTLTRQNALQNSVLVMDVTGSMGPYIADLSDYLKQNKSKFLRYYFFNDGNNMPDYAKKQGQTGGIYSSSNKDFDALTDTILEAMLKGNGGDIPENDFEAILYAQKENEKANKIVWIADNFAFPRDTGLWSKVKIPMLIILCGSEHKINPKWLSLAKKTGAQISLSGAFIPRFPAINEGDIFRVRGEVFVWRKGEFVYN